MVRPWSGSASIAYITGARGDKFDIFCRVREAKAGSFGSPSSEKEKKPDRLQFLGHVKS